MSDTIEILAIEGDQPQFVTLLQAKAHLKIDHDYEDDLIPSIIAAAVAAAENYTGVSINQKVVVLGFSSWPDKVELKNYPVVDSDILIKYYNIENELVELPIGAYKLFESLNDAPIVGAVTATDVELYDRDDAAQISFVAGMTQQNIPAPLYQAILLQIGDFYHFRTDRTEITNRSSMALMRPYKVWV